MSLSEWIELITLIEFDVGLVSTDQSQDTEGIEDFYKILKITNFQLDQHLSLFPPILWHIQHTQTFEKELKFSIILDMAGGGDRFLPIIVIGQHKTHFIWSQYRALYPIFEVFELLLGSRSCKRSRTLFKSLLFWLAGELSWLAVEVLTPCQK